MNKVLYDPKKQRIPIKFWLNLENLEHSALEQILNLSNLPFAYHHIAIMPDCHTGYGMPIGGVLATKNVVVPNAVGVDIGCGMCAVKTSLKKEQLDTDILKRIMGEIRKVIPVGMVHHKEKQDFSLMPLCETPIEYTIHNKDRINNMKIISEQFSSALHQLGTLGGGNHFIEIQKDTDDMIWIMIHSGSRNLGFKVAKYYNEIAKEMNKKFWSDVPLSYGLAFLPLDSKEGQDYMIEMQYCVDFALANRKLMMNRIKEVICFILHMKTDDLFFPEDTNIAHNYASLENHFGENVIVHRKGATLARKGIIGIIPGSQGSKSYIVKGLGNPESFMSCSHGAGRLMSRSKARATLDLGLEQKKLDDQGIIHSIRHSKDLDEASSAYKDINEVINNQKDLVEILVELTPLAVVKG